LKEFGVSRLLKKKEYPRCHKKKVVGPPGRRIVPALRACQCRRTIPAGLLHRQHGP
jgi:hypothetical protein